MDSRLVPLAWSSLLQPFWGVNKQMEDSFCLSLSVIMPFKQVNNSLERIKLFLKVHSQQSQGEMMTKISIVNYGKE